MSYGSIGNAGGSGGGGGFSQQDDTRRVNQLIERCTYNVQKLDNNVKDLERLCAQLNAGRPSNMVAITAAIGDKQSDTNSLISTSADLLKEMGSLRTEDNMLNTRRTRLIEQYKVSVAKYKRAQETAMRRVHDIVAAAAQQELHQPESEQQQQQQQRSGIAVQDQLRANTELLDMQSQEQRMQDLLGDIVNIEEIFQRLSSMVEEQGIMCDDIAQNVDSAADYVEEGREQLRQAVVYKRKARKRCIIIIVIAVVAAGILALVIWLSVRGH